MPKGTGEVKTKEEDIVCPALQFRFVDALIRLTLIVLSRSPVLVVDVLPTPYRIPSSQAPFPPKPGHASSVPGLSMPRVEE